MADYVAGLSVSLDDQVSAGADAAAARLQKLADAADKAQQSTDNLSSTTSRVGPSYDAVNKKIDENAALVAKLDTVNRQYTQGLAAVKAALDAGKISEDDATQKEQRLAVVRDQGTAAAQKQAAAMKAMFSGSDPAGDIKKVSDATEHASGMTAGFTRELVVMAHELSQGNFSNLAGSMLVLTERSKTLSAIVQGFIGGLMGWPGVLAAAAAGLALATVKAEEHERVMATLRQQLRATRDDYLDMASAVQTAAKAVAQSSLFTTSDARAAAQSFASQPSFSGTTQQLEQLVKIAGDAATMLGVTLPDEAKVLTGAMGDPAKAVQEMADKRLFGFNQAMATAIERMANGGDRAGAFGAIMTQVATSTHDAATKGATPLQNALNDLKNAFGGSEEAAGKFGDSLGKRMADSLAGAIEKVAELIKGLQDLDRLTAIQQVHQLTAAARGNNDGTSPATMFWNSLGYKTVPQQQQFTPPASQSGISGDINMAASSVSLDPNLLARLQAAEGVMKNGAWQNNGSHIGPMQVGTATFSGMQAQPQNYPITSTLSDLSNPTQNIQAGAELFAHLLKKYGDVTLAVLAYHDGEPVIDQVLASHGTTSPSQAAIAEANKVLSGYTGSGWGGSGTAPLAVPKAATPVATSTPTTTPVSTNYGAINTPDTIYASADKYASGGITSTGIDLNTRLQALQAGLAQAQKDADSFDETVSSNANERIAVYTESINKLKAAQQDNITVQEQAVRQSNLQTEALAAQNPVVRQLLDIQIQQQEATRKAGQDYDPAKTAQLQTNALKNLSDQFYQNVAATDRSTDALQREVPILEKGGEAAEFAANAVKAQEDARTHFLPGSDAYKKAVAAETASLNNNTQAKAANTAAIDISHFNQQNQLLQAEIGLLGTDTTTRTTLIAGLQEHLKLTGDLNIALNDEQQKAVNAAQANASLNLHYQQMQSSLTELSNIASNAFDQLSQGIVNAFTSGSGAAVNFGSIVKSVLASVLTQVAKLAIINPITNTLFGGNNPTLGSALSALAGNSSTQGGAGSGSSLTSIGTNIFSIGKDLYSGLTNFGAAGTEPLGALGNWSLSSIGIGDAPFTIADVGAANIGSPLALEAAQESAFAGGSAAGGTTLNSLLTSPIFGTNLTVAGGLGGLAAGYGAGTFVGGLVQQGLNKTGPGAQIGAGVGAAAGVAAAALAPETFGASLILAGLIGGTLGGAGGGLIGPHPASPYTSEQVTVTDSGQLALGRVASQGYDDTQELQALTQDLQTLNNFLTASGIKVGNKGGPGGGFQSPGELFQIGQNSPNGPIDPTKFASLADAFGKLNFTSDNSLLNDKVLSKLYDNFTDLSNAVGKFNTAQTGFTNYMASMDATMEQVNKTTGALHETLQGYTDQTTAAVNQAEALIQTGMLSGDQTEKLIDAETKLWKVRDDATAAANAAVIAQNDQQNAGLNYRFAVANASLTGNPQDAENAALYQFDQVTAPQNRQQFSDYWVGVYGSAIKDTQGYADEMAALERTLGEERLAIIKQYNDQITAQQQQAVTEAAQLAAQAQQERDQATNSATQLVQSIGQYLLKLETGSTSPLNSSSQYDLAKSQYSLIASGALGGNFTDSQQLTTYADAFLNSSRAQFGSGANYVTDFTNVLNDLSSLTGQGSDTLTNSAFAAETRTQTASLVDAINEVRNEIVNLRAQVQQSSLTPARVA